MLVANAPIAFGRKLEPVGALVEIFEHKHSETMLCSATYFRSVADIQTVDVRAVRDGRLRGGRSERYAALATSRGSAM